MTSADQAQLLTAEVRWGDDAGAILWVGTAPVHQFWPLLAPHFSESFLPPQRRMEGDAVAWTWRGSESEVPASGAIAALRAKLAADLEQFGQSQGKAGVEDSPRAKKNRESLALLLLLVEGFVSDLLAKSDAELAKFIATTDAGLRVHSWGAKTAAKPLGPEQLGREVSGLALNSGKPAAGVTISLESTDGVFKTSAQSDESGHFRFSNVARGGYRLTGRHASMEFSAQGTAVSVEGEPVTGLKLRAMNAAGPDSDPDQELAEDAEPGPKRRRRPAVYVAAGAAILGGLIWLIASGIPQRLFAQAGSTSANSPSAPQSSPTAGTGSKPSSTDTTTRIEQTRNTALTRSAAGASSPSSGLGAGSHVSAPLGGQAVSAGGQATSTAASSAPLEGQAVSNRADTPSGGQATSKADSHQADADKKDSPAKTPPGGQAVSKAEAKAGPGGQAGAKGESPRREGSKKEVPGKPSPPSPPKSNPTKADAKSDSTHPAPDRPSVPEDRSPAEDQAARERAAPAPAGGWAHRTRVSSSAWKIRLLVDPILPTAPDGDTSVTALEALRQKLMTEQRAKIPSTFQQPHAIRGYAVDLPDPATAAGFHWQTPADSTLRAEISPGMAELSWNEGTSLAFGAYTLVDSAGVAWAQVTVTPGALPVFASRTPVSARCWFQVDVEAKDPGAPGRFKWQRSSGGTLPANWRQKNIAGKLRVEAPIVATPGQTRSDRLALFDADSGWGLTTVIDQAALSAL